MRAHLRRTPTVEKSQHAERWMWGSNPRSSGLAPEASALEHSAKPFEACHVNVDSVVCSRSVSQHPSTDITCEQVVPTGLLLLCMTEGTDHAFLRKRVSSMIRRFAGNVFRPCAVRLESDASVFSPEIVVCAGYWKAKQSVGSTAMQPTLCNGGCG
eukprot:5640165-Amphidinium_carterae.1